MKGRIALLGALCASFVLVGGAGASGSGSVALTAVGVPHAEDFNTLANSGTANTALPTGWYLAESGTSARNNDAYGASTGSDNAGDTYSFGAAGSTERAFGTLLSGTLTPTIGAKFTNDTGQTIGQLAIAYTGEQWRLGATARGADRLDLQVSTDATSLITGTWTNVDVLDFSSPITAGTAGLLDGNAAANRTAVAATVPLTVAPGGSFWIRWTDFNVSSSDDGLAVDDFSLRPIAEDGAPEVQTTSPANGATAVAPGGNITVTFDEPVNVSASSFDIACANSGAHAAAVSGGPTTFTLDPDTAFAFSESCTVTILAANVTDQDTNDPPDAMQANFVFRFTTDEAFFCGDPATPIHAVQGSGAASPLAGSSVQIEGVVVGDFQGTGQFGGYYVQEEDAEVDGNVATSEGIFVFNTSTPVSVGDVVRVRGTVTEFNGLTELTAVNAVSACSTGASVTPASVSLPTDLEAREGMLVRLTQALVISEYFNYERFGELVLGQPLAGESRPFTPTLVEEPGLSALARLTANLERRITLDDGLNVQNPPSIRHPNGSAFSLANRFRGGDTVQNTIGVLGFDFGLYRIQPTGPADYTAVNQRPAAPEDVGGSVKVAAFNTLNYFLTLDYPTGNPLDNKCGPLQNVECRGADFDQPTEFTRQRDKLLAALAGIDGDIVGLNELENTPGVDPLGDPVNGLVTGLNAMLGAGTYDSIDTPVLGGDAIRVGMVYKPGKVTPVGDFEILTSSVDPRFIERRSRPALAQTFEVIATGARFTVVANHLKSKGSACTTAIDGHFDDPDLGDGQGNCNVTRRLAAEALVDYTNLVEQHVGTYAYSFVFDGMAGYLDHALSTPSLTGQVTGVTEWHINADEPDVLDYDTSFKPPAQDALYEANAYRSSDHDPLLVGLDPTTTFAGLCEATERAVSHVGIARSLCAKLDAADAADARGNDEAKDGALAAYVNELRAQTGKSITAERAEQLIELVDEL
jgi:predicted extracellular nuclease